MKLIIKFLTWILGEYQPTQNDIQLKAEAKRLRKQEKNKRL